VASYEETLVNISLDADESIAVDTSPPYTGNAAPTGGSAAAGFQYRFVKVTGAHECGLYTGDEGDIVVGVLQNKPQIPGQAATVAVLGISLVEADGAIEAGATVGVGTYGRATSGGDLGIAIHAADEAGQLIPVLLRLNTTAATA
jgi:hypothetical protein